MPGTSKKIPGDIPLSELVTQDVSEKNIERMARGFIMGTQAVGRRSEVRQILEDKVMKKIGRKGKYLTDKLFELIEGVYVVDKVASKVRGGTEVRYYKVPPSLPAIIYALDRVLGKPVAHIEKSEEKKGILVVEHIIRNLAGNRNGIEKDTHDEGDTTGDERVGVEDDDNNGSRKVSL